MYNNSRLDRRTVLRTAAGLSCGAIAGCLGDDNEATTRTPADGDATPPGQDTLERVAVDGTTLVVELTGDAEVDWVNLIWPNGELFGRRDVPAGVQQVSFELGTSYDPGEYQLLALQGEETVVETSLEIRPNLEIVAMGVGRNQPKKMWDGATEEIADEAFVTVKNSGTGPDGITKLLFLGDVPYPSDENGTNYANVDRVSGIYDPSRDEEISNVAVGPKQEVTIYSSRTPFAFVPGGGVSCKGEMQSGEFEVVLKTGVASSPISTAYSIQYSASEQFDECEITISEE